MEKKIILGKRRNAHGKRIRKDYEAHRTKARMCEIADLVPVRDDYCNTISTFVKDNYLCVIKSISGQEE